MISDGRMYWLTGNLNAFLLKLVELLVLFPQVEFADHVMLPMLLARVVIFAELVEFPLNRSVSLLVSEYSDEVGLTGF